MAEQSPSIREDEVLVHLSFQYPHPANEFPDRRILLSRKKPSAKIGRTSKRVPEYTAGIDNCWIDSPVISRVHAEIYLDAESMAVYLKDEDSRHGTFLNKSRVYPDRPERLDSGSAIRLGIDIQRERESFPPPCAQVELNFGKSAPLGTTTSAQDAAHTPLRPSGCYQAPDLDDDDSDACSSEDDHDAIRDAVHRLRAAAVSRAPKISHIVDDEIEIISTSRVPSAVVPTHEHEVIHIEDSASESGAAKGADEDQVVSDPASRPDNEEALKSSDSSKQPLILPAPQDNSGQHEVETVPLGTSHAALSQAAGHLPTAGQHQVEGQTLSLYEDDSDDDEFLGESIEESDNSSEFSDGIADEDCHGSLDEDELPDVEPAGAWEDERDDIELEDRVIDACETSQPEVHVSELSILVGRGNTQDAFDEIRPTNFSADARDLTSVPEATLNYHLGQAPECVLYNRHLPSLAHMPSGPSDGQIRLPPIVQSTIDMAPPPSWSTSAGPQYNTSVNQSVPPHIQSRTLPPWRVPAQFHPLPINSDNWRVHKQEFLSARLANRATVNAMQQQSFIEPSTPPPPQPETTDSYTLQAPSWDAEGHGVSIAQPIAPGTLAHSTSHPNEAAPGSVLPQLRDGLLPDVFGEAPASREQHLLELGMGTAYHYRESTPATAGSESLSSSSSGASHSADVRPFTARGPSHISSREDTVSQGSGDSEDHLEVIEGTKRKAHEISVLSADEEDAENLARGGVDGGVDIAPLPRAISPLSVEAGADEGSDHETTSSPLGQTGPSTSKQTPLTPESLPLMDADSDSRRPPKRYRRLAEAVGFAAIGGAAAGAAFITALVATAPSFT